MNINVKPPSAKTSATALEALTEKAIKTGKTGNAVKTTPGHGTAGRHPTRELLDALSGHKDPGMFGRMFPMLPPLKVADAKLDALAECDDRLQSRRGDRQQSEHTGRLHLFRPVRRSRHHARPDLARRQGERSSRHRELPHAERRSRLRLRARSGRQPAPLCAQSGRRQQARTEDADRQEHQCRLRRRHRQFPERPGAFARRASP